LQRQAGVDDEPDVDVDVVVDVEDEDEEPESPDVLLPEFEPESVEVLPLELDELDDPPRLSVL